MALLTAFSLANHGTLVVGLEIDIKSDLVTEIDRGEILDLPSISLSIFVLVDGN